MFIIEVTLPLLSTVIVGMLVDDPYVPAIADVDDRVNTPALVIVASPDIVPNAGFDPVSPNKS